MEELKTNSSPYFNNNNNNNDVNITKDSNNTHQKVSISIILAISLPIFYVSLLHLPLDSLFRDTTFWFLITNSIIVAVAADSGIFSSSSLRRDHGDDLYEEIIEHNRAAVRNFSPVQQIKEHHESDHENNNYSNMSIVSANDKLKESSKESEPKSTSSITNAVDEKECIKDEEVINEEKAIILKPKREVKYNRSGTELSVVKPAENQKEEQDGEVGPRRRCVPRSETMVVENRRCGMEESEYWNKMSDEELNRRVEEFISRFNREIRLEARMGARSTTAVY